METELSLVWQVVNELAEQLAHNHKLATNLNLQAGSLKVCFSLSLFRCAAFPCSWFSRGGGGGGYTFFLLFFLCVCVADDLDRNKLVGRLRVMH